MKKKNLNNYYKQLKLRNKLKFSIFNKQKLTYLKKLKENNFNYEIYSIIKNNNKKIKNSFELDKNKLIKKSKEIIRKCKINLIINKNLKKKYYLIKAKNKKDNKYLLTLKKNINNDNFSLNNKKYTKINSKSLEPHLYNLIKVKQVYNLKNSSFFASKTKKIMNKKDITPGPGTYNTYTENEIINELENCNNQKLKLKNPIIFNQEIKKEYEFNLFNNKLNNSTDNNNHFLTFKNIVSNKFKKFKKLNNLKKSNKNKSKIKHSLNIKKIF